MALEVIRPPKKDFCSSNQNTLNQSVPIVNLCTTIDLSPNKTYSKLTVLTFINN